MVRTSLYTCLRRNVPLNNHHQRFYKRPTATFRHGNIEPIQSPPPSILHETQGFEISRLAEKTGVRLTPQEMQLLRNKLGCTGNGVASLNEVKRLGKEAQELQWARELLLSAVEQPSSKMDKLASKLVLGLDFMGKGLFAVVGTQVAGDADMNLVGAVLVGCVSCMGGGTLNNLLYGHSTLDRQTGVRWVHNPTILYNAIICSVITFFLWPIYCREQAKVELREYFGDELSPDGSVHKEAFVHMCERDPEFRASVAAGLGLKGDKAAEQPEKLFDLADSDGSGSIELDEMQHLVGKRFSGSDLIYGLDTLAFASLSVFGVHQATTRGLTPLAACTSGITICFGGIMRDVLCGKNIAVGGQSYALATWAGSCMYVALRELGIRGHPVSLMTRIILSFSTTVAVRVAEYMKGEPLLRPMHYHPDPKSFAHHHEEERRYPVVKLIRHVTRTYQQPVERAY